MGMYDNLRCDAPLPDGRVDASNDWQTKDGPCEMGLVVITADGQLVFEEAHIEEVPEQERPHYGTPKWKEDGLWRLAGSLKRVVDGTYVVPRHGDVHFYRFRCNGDQCEEYRARFTNGRLDSITAVDG